MGKFIKQIVAFPLLFAVCIFFSACEYTDGGDNTATARLSRTTATKAKTTVTAITPTTETKTETVIDTPTVSRTETETNAVTTQENDSNNTVTTKKTTTKTTAKTTEPKTTEQPQIVAPSDNGAPYLKLTDGKITTSFYGTYNSFDFVQTKNGIVTFSYSNHNLSDKNKIFKDKNDNLRKYAGSTGEIAAMSARNGERLLFEMTNAFRAQKGLAALKWNEYLANAARDFCVDLGDYWNSGYGGKLPPDHNRRDGADVMSRIVASGYFTTKNWRAYAENIGYTMNYGDESPLTMFDGWINSAHHRDNILSTKVVELGVGLYEKQIDGAAYLFGAQDFGAKA
ncbi:MAG: CAP domain-containing protein [Oscillospiraceae bacterium]|jgi:uncharacterized protein YkwD|nr:CAP domain-containing protein [Oscillospiraceae bacterium]